ncbi:hypothetical protein PUNSTDRAFT_134945 [Punctularia strigosozonata HHB-11173 SS5]|uniref:uncharacterized protein n=1 Tax=Punctularia strigosozonata (strain HHB-11173) TaxID=741275 RepID=UPI0004416502|nr:uncharacterized protein PUNSTDRAFT_134945 [Punctularia strigosozonata HHB-11173 SS5]EIN08572.1 hypothetical protein PUNSTDRAFT_134945 [Punctularia strigosozonata HHB-11173 SS5]
MTQILDELTGDRAPEDGSPPISRSGHCPSCSCPSLAVGDDDADGRSDNSVQAPGRKQLALNQLEEIRKRMLALRAEHNASLPIHVLPVEILVMIFISPLTDWFLGCQDQKWSQTLVQVCSRWRRVALETPALWTFLTLPNTPAGAIGLFERFNEHPLRLFWDDFGRPTVQSQALLPRIISKHSLRIVELRISNHRREGLKTALNSIAAFSLDAPALRVLEIRPHMTSCEGRLKDLDEHLCKLNAPALESLTLTFPLSKLLWESCILHSPSLRHLSVGYDGYSGVYSTPRLPNVLDVLRHLPSLERLRLHAVADGEQGAGEVPVVMNALQELDLSGTVRYCVNILKNLKFTTLSYLRIIGRIDEGEDVGEMWQLVDGLFPAQPMLHLDLIDDEPHFNIKCGQTWIDDDGPYPLTIMFEAESPSDILDAFVKLVPRFSRSITTLSFSGWYPESWNEEIDLRRTLAGWSSVQTVFIRYTPATMSFSQAIRTSDQSRDDRPSWILPNLTSLTIEIEDGEYDGEGIRWFDLCREELELRCRSGVRDDNPNPAFKSITFIHCTEVSEKDLDHLRMVVPEVKTFPTASESVNSIGFC